MPDLNPTVLYVLSLLLAGLGSGFVGGLFGVGGGILRVPIFLFMFPIFGVDPTQVMHVAAGTSLALAIPTGLRSAMMQRASAIVCASPPRVGAPGSAICGRPSPERSETGRPTANR